MSGVAPRGVRYPALDGLRAVGALFVVLTHVGFQSGDALAGPFAGFLSRLDVGVAVFFVLSGFLLFRPHVAAHLAGAPRPALRSYLRHRALRILPVLWVAVPAAYVLAPTAGASAGDYLSHALLVQIYGSDVRLQGLTQMWSLATEVAFYLCLPLVAAATCRGTPGRAWVTRRLVLTGALLLAGPAWMWWCTAVGLDRGRLWLPGYVGWFGAGMALALWTTARDGGILGRGAVDDLLRRPGTVWSVAGALFVIVSTPAGGPLGLTEPSPAAAAFKNLAYGLIGLLVVAPGTVREAPPAPTRLLSGRVARFLGEISYGVFAYHVVVLTLVDSVAGLGVFTGHFWPRLGLTLLGTLLAATASYRLLERPVLDRGRRSEPGPSTGASSPDTEQASTPATTRA